MKVSSERLGISDLWLARVLWIVAAVGFAMAAAGHLILYRTFAHYPGWLPRLDEPVLFWLLVPPFALVAYTTMAVFTRQAIMRAADYVPPSLLLAVIVCGFIGLLNSNEAWFTERAWNIYLLVLAGALVFSVFYIREAFRKSAESPRTAP